MNEGRVERRLDQSFALRLRHFDKVAEEIVVLDLDLPELGEFAIACLQGSDNAPALVAQRAGFVERCVVAHRNEIAGAAIERQVRCERRGQRLRDAAIDFVKGGLRQRDLTRQIIAGNEPRHFIGRHKPGAHCLQVARAAAAERQPRQGAHEVRRVFQPLAHITAQVAILDQESHAGKPLRNRCDFHEWRGETLRQKPRPCRRNRAIDRRQKRACAFAGERTRQFEIGAGRSVDLHDVVTAHARRARQIRPRADLRSLDKEKRGCRSDRFRARQRTETVECRHSIILREPALGGNAVAALASERRQRRTGAAEGRGELVIRTQRFRRNDFARIKPRQFHRQSTGVCLNYREGAG